MVFSIVTSGGGHNAKNRSSIGPTRAELAPKTCHGESPLPSLVSVISFDLIFVDRSRGERARLLVSETVLTSSEKSSVGQFMN